MKLPLIKVKIVPPVRRQFVYGKISQPHAEGIAQFTRPSRQNDVIRYGMNARVCIWKLDDESALGKPMIRNGGHWVALLSELNLV